MTRAELNSLCERAARLERIMALLWAINDVHTSAELEDLQARLREEEAL